MFFNISTHMNVDYIVTEERYVTMMGPVGKCPILFMIDFFFNIAVNVSVLGELLWFTLFILIFDISFW